MAGASSRYNGGSRQVYRQFLQAWSRPRNVAIDRGDRASRDLRRWSDADSGLGRSVIALPDLDRIQPQSSRSSRRVVARFTIRPGCATLACERTASAISGSCPVPAWMREVARTGCEGT